MAKNKELKKVIAGIKFFYDIDSNKKISEILNTGETFISDMLSGKSKVSEETSEKFKSIWGVNPEYLLYGKEPIFLKDDSNIQIGDNNTSVAGNSNNVNNSSTLERAINEISEMRKLLQEQIRDNKELSDKLILVIERLTAK